MIHRRFREMTLELSLSERKEFQKLLDSGISLPAQPSIMQEIEHLIHRPKVRMDAIAKMISSDTALTAIIFKIIGSPIYGLRKPVDSVEKAISLIGVAQLDVVVKSAALRQSISGAEPFYEWFWEHSGEIAQLCSIIAYKQRSVCNIYADDAQLAGLFHDCGVPLLMQRFPEYCKSFRLAHERKWPNVVMEDNMLHTDHAVVGYLIARHWNLPDFVCQAVRFHHDILNTEHKATTMVAILHMARHIYNIYHFADDSEWEANYEQILDEIGISTKGLKEFEEEVYDTLKTS